VFDGFSSRGYHFQGAALDSRLLAGRYRLDRVLGSGGTGTVWLGFDTQLTRAVAVKELHIPDTIDQAEAREMAERVMIEAQSAARIDHPNVVKVYDVLSEEGKPWLVMQLVHGQTLEQKLRAGPLTIAQAATVGLGVVEALAAAHALGIVHRDVKPANVLLAGNGQVLLTDFSIAKVIGRPGITRNSNVWGTPGYVAPELVKNWTPGPPSDLFGLGVLLFRAVEGYGPFDRGDPQAAMIAPVTEPHPRPAHAGPLTPVIDGLLEKDPMVRWTAQATRAAVNAIARVEPASAPFRPVAPVPPVNSRSVSAPLANPPSDRVPPVNLPSAPMPSGPVPPNSTVKTTKPPRKFGVGTLSVTVTATVAVTVALTLAFTHGAPSATSTPIPTTAPPTTPANGPQSTSPSLSASVTVSPSSSTIVATQPQVYVDKAAIQSGDQVIIKGAGFKPGETVYIDLVWVTPRYQIAKATVGPGGDWGSIVATITESSPGPSSDYSIVATGQTGDTAHASISIEAR
jgi:eukaryotic-like serine/threonine-protein kinase